MVEAPNNMGNSYRKIGKTEKAELYYRKALNIKEKYSPAYSNLLFLQSSISHDTDLHKSEAKNFAKIFRKDIKDPYTNWPYEYNTNTLRVGFVSDLQSPCWIFLDSSELNSLNIEILLILTIIIRIIYEKVKKIFLIGEKSIIKMIKTVQN